MGYLVRFLLFCLILIIAYFVLRYIFNPKRKLELAQQNKELFLLDDFNNVKKNLLITHRGVLFEGEKSLGTAENAFRVIHIRIWPHHPEQLHGLSKRDFEEMEEALFRQYPFAVIEWESPIKELLSGQDPRLS